MKAGLCMEVDCGSLRRRNETYLELVILENDFLSEIAHDCYKLCITFSFFSLGNFETADTLGL